MRAYYNEWDADAAGWLRNLIAAGLLPAGDVDERSIADVQPEDLAGYGQCHFFAGIGGWPYAAQLAGWPADRPIWTGSCPCQPFSVAGKGGGTDDERHLWPDFFRLIRSARPAVVMGEQVAGKAGYGWLDGVRADLASEGYASRGVDIPACSVDAPHQRNRIYWLAYANSPGLEVRRGECSDDGPERSPFERTDGCSGLADCDGSGRDGRTSVAERFPRDGTAAQGNNAGCLVHAPILGRREGRPEHVVRGGRHSFAGADAHVGLGISTNPDHGRRLVCEPSQGAGQGHIGAPSQLAGPDGRNGTFWSDAEWIACHDGKARRTQPGTPLLAHGVSRRVAKWRGLGNAIVPQVAAEVIAAFLETEHARAA